MTREETNQTSALDNKTNVSLIAGAIPRKTDRTKSGGYPKKDNAEKTADNNENVCSNATDVLFGTANYDAHDDDPTLLSPSSPALNKAKRAATVAKVRGKTMTKVKAHFNGVRSAVTPAGAGGKSRARSKATPARGASKSPNPSKLVTPTPSAKDKKKFLFSTPEATAASTKAATSANVSARRGNLEISSNWSSEKVKNTDRTHTLFPEVVHAMVEDATKNMPAILHWNKKGDAFYVEETVSLSLLCSRGLIESSYL